MQIMLFQYRNNSMKIVAEVQKNDEYSLIVVSIQHYTHLHSERDQETLTLGEDLYPHSMTKSFLPSMNRSVFHQPRRTIYLIHTQSGGLYICMFVVSLQKKSV